MLDCMGMCWIVLVSVSLYWYVLACIGVGVLNTDV